MKKWMFFSLALCCVTSLMAQEVISYKTAVKYKGDTIEVKLMFDILPGMHVYAPSLLNESQGYSIMKLMIDSLPAGLMDLKMVDWSEPVMEAGGVLYKGNGHSVVFRLLGRPQRKLATLKGTLNYQGCNEEMCFPPDEKTFSVELKKGK